MRVSNRMRERGSNVHVRFMRKKEMVEFVVFATKGDKGRPRSAPTSRRRPPPPPDRWRWRSGSDKGKLPGGAPHCSVIFGEGQAATWASLERLGGVVEMMFESRSFCGILGLLSLIFGDCILPQPCFSLFFIYLIFTQPRPLYRLCIFVYFFREIMSFVKFSFFLHCSFYFSSSFLCFVPFFTGDCVSFYASF